MRPPGTCGRTPGSSHFLFIRVKPPTALMFSRMGILTLDPFQVQVAPAEGECDL